MHHQAQPKAVFLRDLMVFAVEKPEPLLMLTWHLVPASLMRMRLCDCPEKSMWFVKDK